MAGIPRFKAPVPETPILTVDQINAVLNVCKGRDFLAVRDTAIVMVLFETGMRREELVNLQVDDIDLHNRTARIRHGKGGRPRTVAFGPNTTDALRKYLRVRPDKGEWLWLSIIGTHITVAGVAQLLKRRGSAADLPGLRAHQFRHSWAHYSLLSGVDSLDVQTLAGWTSGAQLGRYAAITRVDRALAAAHSKPVGDVLRKRS